MKKSKRAKAEEEAANKDQIVKEVKSEDGDQIMEDNEQEGEG